MLPRSLADGRSESRLRLLGIAVFAVLAARSVGAAAPAAPAPTLTPEQLLKFQLFMEYMQKKGQKP